MPQRSALYALPEAIRGELDQRLIKSGFADYRGLSEWLAEHGYEISHAAVHRYGRKFQDRAEKIRHATEQAEALVAASGDETGAMADASLRLIQERMLDVLLRSEDQDIKALSAAARSLADAARAGSTIRAERRKSAEIAVREARRRGISPETAEAIRNAIESPARTEARMRRARGAFSSQPL